MNIERITNEWLHSNTYILSRDGDDGVWLVDCGDYDKVDLWLKEHHKHLVGILVTHSHHDHIYGIQEALAHYPEIPIYLSKNQGRIYMKDAKLNMSRYTGTNVSIEYDSFIDIAEGDKITLWDSVVVAVLDTPGHTPDCVSYISDGYIFTGDAYIPHLKMTSRAKGGDKEQLALSMGKIFDLVKTQNLRVCPGHNEIETAEELKDDLICTIHIH